MPHTTMYIQESLTMDGIEKLIHVHMYKCMWTDYSLYTFFGEKKKAFQQHIHVSELLVG